MNMWNMCDYSTDIVSLFVFFNPHRWTERQYKTRKAMKNKMSFVIYVHIIHISKSVQMNETTVYTSKSY